MHSCSGEYLNFFKGDVLVVDIVRGDINNIKDIKKNWTEMKS